LINRRIAGRFGEAVAVDSTGENVVFQAVDTGIGIPAKKIDSLFTEFKQTGATIATRTVRSL
jgi:signal transduction histidine kinase